MAAERVADIRQNHQTQKLPTKAAHAVRVVAKDAHKAHKEATKAALRASRAGDTEALEAALWEIFERSEFMWDAAVQLLAGEYADMDDTLMAFKKWDDERKANRK